MKTGEKERLGGGGEGYCIHVVFVVPISQSSWSGLQLN